ncbi:hypothetical protein MMC07_001095 [Pseudocyphellaria aurata]|nr:hypothetical protein [Pseudocyphellaria aurata]
MFIPKVQPTPTDPAVVDQLKSLSKKIDDLTKEKDVLSAKTAELEIRLRASEHNSVARLANATSTATPLILEPLRALATNDPIPSFPRTERELRLMSSANVVDVLKALDASIHGTPGERKARLRQECGRMDEMRDKGWTNVVDERGENYGKEKNYAARDLRRRASMEETPGEV